VGQFERAPSWLVSGRNFSAGRTVGWTIGKGQDSGVAVRYCAVVVAAGRLGGC